MLWLQSMLCFCAWVGYGVWLARSKWAKRLLPRTARGLLLGPALFILGMLLLVGALFFVSANSGLVQGTLRPWAVILVLLAGVVFVHTQCLGALWILQSATRPETTAKPHTSVNTEDSL